MRGLLQHCTKSSIIPISKGKSVWKNKKAQKRTVSLEVDRDCLLDLQTIPGHWNRWFCRKLHRPVHHCSSKWRCSRIRFEVGRNIVVCDEHPTDDILEGLYKLRIRESEKLKTVLELYDLEIHQKKLGPDCHRLKRSIEQEIRNKNLGARNGNFWEEHRGQESGNKTTCAQNSWRLSAMGKQRATCERR